MILDAIEAVPAPAGGPPADFALRGAVKRWSRSQGVHAIAACAAAPTQTSGGKGGSRGLLAGLLLEAGSADVSGAMAVMDWFNSAGERAGPLMERLRLDPRRLQHSTQLKSFPLLVAGKQGQ